MPYPFPPFLQVVWRFDAAGLVSVVVNLISRMAGWRYAVEALTDAVLSLCARVLRDGTHFHSVHRTPDHGLGSRPAPPCILRPLQLRAARKRALAALVARVAARQGCVPLRVRGAPVHDRKRKRHLVRQQSLTFVSGCAAFPRKLERDRINIAGFTRHAVTQTIGRAESDCPSPTGSRQFIPRASVRRRPARARRGPRQAEDGAAAPWRDRAAASRGMASVPRPSLAQHRLRA